MPSGRAESRRRKNNFVGTRFLIIRTLCGLCLRFCSWLKLWKISHAQGHFSTWEGYGDEVQKPSLFLNKIQSVPSWIILGLNTIAARPRRTQASKRSIYHCCSSRLARSRFRLLLDKQDNEAALLDTFTLSCTLFSRTDWVKKSLQAQKSATISS